MSRPDSPQPIPDVMFRCPACGVVPAVFWTAPDGTRYRCDHCHSVLDVASVTEANPGISFPSPPAPNTAYAGGVFQLARTA